MNIYKGVFIVAFFTLISFGEAIAQATTVEVTGSNSVGSGDIVTYNAVFKNALGQTVTPPVLLTDSYDWRITGNYVLLDYSNYSCRIQWTETGSHTIEYSAQSADRYFADNLVVMVNIGPPIANAATNVGISSLTANWSSVSGASSYRLDVTADATFSSNLLGYDNLTVNGTSQLITGLIPGMTYYYRVRAYGASGTTQSSNVIVAPTLPVAPVASAATNIGQTTFTGSWNSVRGGDNYFVEISTSSSFATVVSSFYVFGTSEVITGLLPGTTYYYRVTARNSSGSSVASNVVQLSTLPSTPIAASATNITSTSFTANWGAVSGASNYRIDVSTNSAFTNFVAGYNGLTVTTNFKDINDLTAGAIYYYRVRSTNASGTSSNSNVVSIQLPPSSPVAISATDLSTNSFRANWNGATGATGYLLQISENNSFSPIKFSYNTTSLSQTISGLTPGAIYYYRVTTLGANGNSEYSNVIQTAALPVAPVANNAIVLSSSSISITWSDVTAPSYRLDVSTNAAFSNYVTGYSNLNVNGLTATITGLTTGNIYYIRVRAVNGLGGASANSNVIRVGELSQNYVRVKSILVPGKTDIQQIGTSNFQEVSTNYSFYDGLGRLSQTVLLNESPAEKDIIIPVAYDAFGRENKKYLPYVNGTTGWYRADALGDPNSTATDEQLKYRSGKQYEFYQDGGDVAFDQFPYSATTFDESPLNRVVQKGAPGNVWQPKALTGTGLKSITDKSVQSSDECNSTNEVLLWRYLTPSANSPYLLGLVDASTTSGLVYYAPGSLRRQRTIDEHNNEVISYVDSEGHTVLKRVQVISGSPAINDSNYASTYYIYDDYNNLVCVLPPEASAKLASEYFSATATNTTRENFLKRWAFRYKYDYRKRMIQKQVPGAGQIFMVYDLRDRLVLTQDSVQRLNNQWLFTKFDEMNRPIAAGIKDTTVTLTPAEMQKAVNNHYAKAWTRYGESYIGNMAGNVHGYSNKSYPVFTTGTVTDVNRYLTVTYYDNYNFKNYFGSGYDYINDGLTETINSYLYEQPSNAFASVIGQATGTKVKVLDGGITGVATGGYTWLKSVNYFDDKYRVIQTISDNYKGGKDRISSLYDFVGKVLKTKALHIESDVQWTDLVLTSVVGNYLRRTDPSSAWTAGAASVQSLPAGQDGWVEFVASEENTARMVGLSSQNANASYTSIGYAIHPRNNKTVGIYENGTLRKEIGTYTAGDVFRIARIGSVIKYYINGFEQYTSSVPSLGPLLVDVSLNTTGSTVVGVKTSFSTSTHTILRRYVYDHAGRLKQTFHTLDNGPEVLLASNEYNELGQLIDKGLHSVNGSTPMQSVDYRYNIRGWLTSMNNSELSSDGQTNDDTGDFFGMNLGYNEELGTSNTESMLSNAGLVGSYTLNGNASDAVADGLNGVVYGAQLTADSQGNSASAYNFTANDYIDIPNSKDKHSFIQNTGKFTISAFVKINDLSARSVIVSSTATSTAKGFCFMYETYGSGYGDHQLRFMTTNGSTSFSAVGSIRTINDNNWHHVAVVGDGNTVRFYVDGVSDASPTAITLFSTGSATSTTLIGKTRSASGLFLGMSGAIDEVNIFNEPLDQSEIKELSNRTAFNAILDKGQYNGNISGMKWSVNQGLGDTKEMAYNFEYDALNRLVSANNLQSSLLRAWEVGKYHERNLTYDLNGNITSLSRSSEPGVIDSLFYNYGTGTTQSNKLLSVTDKTTDAIIKLKGFTDSNTTGNDYTYDVNGNMTVDLNKGLSSPIIYNYLNLPEVVTRGGNTVRYIYDAAGRKLSQVVRAGFGIKQTDYAGEFIYEDDMLRFINHEEGRIVMSSEKLLYKHDGETLKGMTALNSTLSVVTVNGEKYVNATSSGTGSGILPIGNAINVVPGERYLIRIKGYRSTYNAGVMIRRNNSTISYGSYLPTPVSNEAWMEQIYVVPPNTNVLEIGVGWSVPTGSAGLNINAFELIKLESAVPEYQYNLKDHLGNVRLTFTSKQDIESDTATLEDENADEEAGQFLRYDNARIVNHFLFDHTKGSKPTQVEGGAQRLSGHGNEIYGLAKSLSVMPGDVINMEVYAKYIDPNESNRTAALNTLIMQIAAGTAPGTTVVDGGNYAASTSSFPFPADATQNTSSSNEASPKAFLSWLVYDRNYTLIPSKSGFRQMSSVSKEDGSDVAHELLSGTVTISEPGYIYVFISNEQGVNPYEVYFDDFNVEQAKSPVIQSQDYYPYGLNFNSYERENTIGNKYKYNGKEEQNELNLALLDYGARMYDPVIGRWNVIDPLTEISRRWSSYNYAYDNPMRYIDPDGMYSTEEWKRDHGVTDNDLTRIYQAKPDTDPKDKDKEKEKEKKKKDAENKEKTREKSNKPQEGSVQKPPKKKGIPWEYNIGVSFGPQIGFNISEMISFDLKAWTFGQISTKDDLSSEEFNDGKITNEHSATLNFFQLNVIGTGMEHKLQYFPNREPVFQQSDFKTLKMQGGTTYKTDQVGRVEIERKNVVFSVGYVLFGIEITKDFESK